MQQGKQQAKIEENNNNNSGRKWTQQHSGINNKEGSKSIYENRIIDRNRTINEKYA